jgi:hypothetical protein
VRFEVPAESGDALEDNCAVKPPRARSKRVKFAGESLPEEEDEEDEEDEDEEEGGDAAGSMVDAKHRKQVPLMAPERAPL